MPIALHVGLDTFAPVTETDPLKHRIHTEEYCVPEATWNSCQEAKRVMAIGTTATRALESVAKTGQLSGRTKLFITPGFKFEIVDLMLTNFHMPRSTLLLMVSAFIGDRWRDLYGQGIEAQYRMLSFGDAMLLNRHL